MNFKNTSLKTFLFITISCFAYSDYTHKADEVSSLTAKKLQKEKGLCLVGTGGQMMDDIQVMSMLFDFFQELSIEKARELLIYTVKEYLLKINNDKEIRPYLHNYPANEKNVDIMISIRKPDGSNVSLGSIKFIYCDEGILTYNIAEKKDSPFSPAFHKETYEEALKILESEKANKASLPEKK